jgi:hypothetical protein
LANCECGRIHKTLPIVDLDFSGVLAVFNHRITSATGFSDTSTRENANHRTNNRRQQIDPEALQVEANNGWAKRARRIHRRAANRAGKHRFQSNPITEPTTIPAVTPFSRAPVETPRITNINSAVRISSRMKDWRGEPAGE